MSLYSESCKINQEFKEIGLINIPSLFIFTSGGVSNYQAMFRINHGRRRTMSYTFLNINTLQTFTCGDDLWIGHLESARANGWDEEGTRFDFTCEVDDAYDPMVDYLYNLWMIFYVSREMFAWDGNYTGKKNQVVSESDAYCLMQALEKEWTSPDRGLLDFLNSGPFRIVRE